jgi:hypothetical protein
MAWCAAAQGQYDLLLKAGHVADSENGISAVRGHAQGIAVEQNIAASRAGGRSMFRRTRHLGLVDMTSIRGQHGPRIYRRNLRPPDGFTFAAA